VGGKAGEPVASMSRGRPTLAERRKEQLRQDIATEALRLFAANGVAATSAEDIAAAAGVSLRTFWRHFPSKESCVEPLLTAAISTFTDWLRSWQPETPLTTALDDAFTQPGDEAAIEVALTVLRLAESERAIREVWVQASYESWSLNAEIFAAHFGLPAISLEVHVWAAMVSSAALTAMQRYAAATMDSRTYDAAEVMALIRRAVQTASEGIPTKSWPSG
jgi:AcrR family transcriptional regulator